MKSAIYIEDGLVQLVITPQTDFERNALKAFGDKLTATVHRGEFYDCNGGWTRWHDTYGSAAYTSLILRADATVDIPQ